MCFAFTCRGYWFGWTLAYPYVLITVSAPFICIVVVVIVALAAPSLSETATAMANEENNAAGKVTGNVDPMNPNSTTVVQMQSGSAAFMIVLWLVGVRCNLIAAGTGSTKDK